MRDGARAGNGGVPMFWGYDTFASRSFNFVISLGLPAFEKSRQPAVHNLPPWIKPIGVNVTAGGEGRHMSDCAMVNCPAFKAFGESNSSLRVVVTVADKNSDRQPTHIQCRHHDLVRRPTVLGGLKQVKAQALDQCSIHDAWQRPSQFFEPAAIGACAFGRLSPLSSGPLRFGFPCMCVHFPSVLVGRGRKDARQV